MKKRIVFASLLLLAAGPAMAGGGDAHTGDSHKAHQGGGMAQGGGLAEGGERMTFEELDTDGDGSISREEARAAGIIRESDAVGGGAAGGGAVGSGQGGVTTDEEGFTGGSSGGISGAGDSNGMPGGMREPSDSGHD